MAFPVVASSATTTASSGTSIIATFPSGLTAGDEMMMVITDRRSSSGTAVAAPSGWTVRERQDNGLVNREHVVMTKTATAGDVSAGSVTVSFATSIGHAAIDVLRITGSTSFVTSESDQYTPTTLDVTPTFTTNVVPTTVNDSLVLVTFGLIHTSNSASRTFSDYAITPSATFTEITDDPVRTGDTGIGSAIASANYTGFSTITSRQAIVSADTNVAYYGSIVIYAGTQNVTADVSHLVVTPSIAGVTASEVTVTADIGHNVIVPIVSGVETDDSSANVTTWTPTPKS
jgi:hypothetical protein